MSEEGKNIVHKSGLCHQPDKLGLEGAFISYEEFQKNHLLCRCCGTTLVPRDSLSLSFQQLGMYEVMCPTCP